MNTVEHISSDGIQLPEAPDNFLTAQRVHQDDPEEERVTARIPKGHKRKADDNQAVPFKRCEG